MRSVRVWAPFAEAVELATLSGRAPMVPAEHGWWEGPVLAADDLYRFVLDGAELPDPRSPRQPDGPMGWSQVVDHDAFVWSDQRWTGFPLAAAIILEIHVGTFSPEGTFDGVIAKLDDLADLGISAIEIMPVATFPGRRGWGYDGVNLFAPHEAYGGPQGLKRLVDACHARNIAVVLDVVYNHLGPSGNTLGRFGPYFTDTYRSPWGDAVNLDGAGSDEVRRFIVDNALQWIVDYHIDGLRLDAVHALHDETAVHILAVIADEVHAAGRRHGRTVWVIAESDLNDPRLVRSRDAHGYGLDAAWSDDFHHAVHVSLTGERDGYYSDFAGIDDLATAIAEVFVFADRFAPSRQRHHGQGIGEMDRTRFVCCAQNHDQIGNRAIGERLAHLISPQRAEVAAALVLTGPCVPMLFQGEEWAASAPFQYFTDMDDPAIGDAVREGRRREFAAFGWIPEQVPDPQDPLTFERSRLNWDERSAPGHARMLDWHRRLIALRAEHRVLRDGRAAMTHVVHDPGADWLAVARGELTIVVNLGEETTIETRPVSAVLLDNGETAVIDATHVRVGRDRVAVLLTPPAAPW